MAPGACGVSPEGRAVSGAGGAAQERRSASEVAPMTVTARARRSHRSGPTGSPAVCRAIPRPVAMAATSGPAPGTVPVSVNAADHGGQAGLAYRVLVLGVLQHRAQGLPGHRRAQL